MVQAQHGQEDEHDWLYLTTARLKYSELIFNHKLIFDAFVNHSLANC